MYTNTFPVNLGAVGDPVLPLGEAIASVTFLPSTATVSAKLLFNPVSSVGILCNSPNGSIFFITRQSPLLSIHMRSFFLISV